MIQELVAEKLESSDALSATDLDTVVEKLVDVVNIGVIKHSTGENLVTVVSNILVSSTDVTAVADT